ncbi:MAG: hypothetical protein E5Y73_03190 [Mesorhizobium sp.]|nr:MAG: hypothetical protein E5Y73_03190 [Mesorhizobium sp.]
MLPAEIKVGHVFRYSYLWHWQHARGRIGATFVGGMHMLVVLRETRDTRRDFGEITDEYIQIRSYRLAVSRLLSSGDRGGAGIVALVGL